MDLDEVRAQYKKIASGYEEDALESGGYRLHEAVGDRIVQVIDERDNDQPSILDLGCGTGLSSLLFFERGWPVVGIDASIDMLRQAQPLPYSGLICGDIRKPLPFITRSFDAAVMVGVLELIDNPQVVFEGLATVLGHGGIAGMSVPIPGGGGDEIGMTTHCATNIKQHARESRFAVKKRTTVTGYTIEGIDVQQYIYVLKRCLS